MSTSFEVRTMSVVVIPIGEEIYSERATVVSIEDEGGGEFVCVKQPGLLSNQAELRLDADDWPVVRQAIDDMIKQCRDKGASQ
jgi:hypothetical protein